MQLQELRKAFLLNEDDFKIGHQGAQAIWSDTTKNKSPQSFD